ncbi:hypothetical protein LXO06_25845, partial [Escherichia coli]|nr:hypothetical protein [Escherichia coli]
SIKNDGHYFCRAGGNRPDGLNEPVTLHQEMRILDDMTSRLPLKWLQREQRHVLYHARWLQRYLDSRRGGSDGDFFLLLHDVAMGTDYQVADILASQHDCKQRRGSQLPVNLKTCP